MFLEAKFANIRYRQFLYSISALLTPIGGAIHSTWTSPYLPQLKSDQSPIGVPITTFESSLIVSSLSVGYWLACPLTIWIYDLIGRKKCLILGGFIDILAWILIYFANSTTMIVFGRIFGGISSQMVLNCAIIYNGEICDDDNRGKMGYLVIIFVTMGEILSYVFGPFTSYHNFAIIAMSIIIFATFWIFFIAESPYHLIRNENLEEAERTVKKLCNNSASDNFIKKRMEEIKKSVEFDMLNKSTLKELFVNRIYWKAFFIQWSCKVLMNTSGISVIKSYMETIISYSGGNISTNTASVVFGIFSVISVLISSFVVDKYGRKPLFATSTALCGICNCSVAIYFYLLAKTSYNLDSVSWIPLAALVGYEIFVGIGLLPIPYILGGELHAMNIKAIAISTIGFTQIPINFGLQIAFEYVIDLWGVYTIFWIFSSFCFIGTLFAIFIFPETKGKSFDEIQKMLNPKRYEHKTKLNKMKE